MKAEDHKVEWLEYDLLLEHQDINAKTFLRHGGTSKGPFFSLNISTNVGDHQGNVKSNRQIIKDIMQVPKMVYATQPHKAEMKRVSASENKELDADVLFTTEKNIALSITHADCQAAIVFDPSKKVLALVHAGWRGLVSDIYQNCILNLEKEEGCKSKDLIVCLSPCLCSDHFEFKDYKKHFPEKYLNFQTKENHFDFCTMAKSDLLSAGVLEKNIEFSDICTSCNEDDYFSYRRDKKTGRNVTTAYLTS